MIGGVILKKVISSMGKVLLFLLACVGARTVIVDALEYYSMLPKKD